MKKKVLLLAFLAMCASVVATGTLAYFTAEGIAHNIITSGKVDIELVEKTKDDSGAEVDFPKNGIGGAMPGTSVSKIVSVKNTGETAAWIRVWVDAEIRKASGSNTDPNELVLPMQIKVEDGTNETYVDAISWQVDADKWVAEAADGRICYYYKEPVEGGESTDILFKEVSFAKEMGNEYQNCKILIDVSAEAVQTANNPIPDKSGSDVTDVKGWPEV